MVLLLVYSFKWQYLAGAGARAERNYGQGGARAEKKNNFGSATLDYCV